MRREDKSGLDAEPGDGRSTYSNVTGNASSAGPTVQPIPRYNSLFRLALNIYFSLSDTQIGLYIPDENISEGVPSTKY